jgi:hypothetical protein
LRFGLLFNSALEMGFFRAIEGQKRQNWADLAKMAASNES